MVIGMKLISVVFLAFLCCISFFGTNVDSFNPETVLIDGKLWMKENLHPHMFARVPVVKGVAYNFKSDLDEVYGNLYTYEEAQKLCPQGWHLPTMEEWNDLFDYLGGLEIAGGEMKTTDKWRSPNEGATNNSGFSAVPAGGANNFNRFDGMGWAAHFWAAEPENGNAYVPSLMHDTAEVYVLSLPLNMKASVRYIKDADRISESTFSIPSGNKVNIDGYADDNEWEDSTKKNIAIDSREDVEVYIKHDGENLLLLFILNSADVKSVLFPEILIENNFAKNTVWTDSNYWFHVSGSDCYAKGKYNEWENCAVESGEWKAVPNYPTDKPGIVECIEISIPFTTAGITKKSSFGFALLVTNTVNSWYYWPETARISDPSTWFEAVLE